MLRKSVATLLAAGAVAAGAPPALAHDVVAARCDFSPSPVAITGEWTYTGTLYGHAIVTDGGAPAEALLRCYVAVDGVEVASTPALGGTGLVLTAGEVTYETDPPYARVEYCAEVTGPDGHRHTACREPLSLSWLDDVIDDSILWEYVAYWMAEVESVTCATLQSLSPGIPGVVDIDDGGDVSIYWLGPFWECPPYEW